MEGLQTKHQSITPTRISIGFKLYFKSLIFYTISDFLALFFQIKILSLTFFHKSLVMQQYKVPSWCSRELQMLNVLQIFPSDSPERMAWYFPSALHSCLLWLLQYFLLLITIGLPSTNMTLLPETNTCKKISLVN